MNKDGQRKDSGIGTTLPKVETPKELVFDRLEKIEGLNKMFLAAMGGDEQRPDWVLKVLVEVMKVHMPGVKMTKAKMNTHFGMGALMGYMLTMAKVLKPESVSSLVAREIEDKMKFSTSAEKCKAKCEAEKKIRMHLGSFLPDETTLSAVMTTAQQALMSLVNLPANEMAEFMRGLEVGTKGASFESFKAHKEFTTVVYSHLIMGWREVEKLGSVTELRKWLLDRMSAIDVGSESRIKKLCSRIGLKLRGRGRPRKAEK